MIVEVNEIPRTKKNHTGQKQQIYIDLMTAISSNVTKFELVDDCYNYKYLAGYVREVADRYFEREVLIPIWKPYAEKISTRFHGTEGRWRGIIYGDLGNLTSLCYSVTSITDEELGRKRVFVTLHVNEELIQNRLQNLMDSEIQKHLSFLKKCYPDVYEKFK
jgi:hypothetical protein